MRSGFSASARILPLLGIPLVTRMVDAQSPCTSTQQTAEFFAGTAWSMRTPLTLRQDDGTTRIHARYSTRPLADAPYYSYRFGIEPPNGTGIEVEMLHHKLYLENPVDPITRLEATHGYNLVTLNAVRSKGGMQLRFGVGVVVGHLEGNIGGRELAGRPTFVGGGYHIAGVTAQAAIGRRYPLARGTTALIAVPEAKVTASWARFNLDPGTLTLPNIAVHALAGLGVRRCSKR